MDEATTHGTDEGRASVRDFDPASQNREASGGSQADRGKSHARVIEEAAEQGRRAAESTAETLRDAQERTTRMAAEAGGELKSLAKNWADDQSVAFGEAANFMLSWQRQVAGFVNTRIERNMRFGRNLLEARDPSTVLRLYGEYGREMMTDYATCLTSIGERSISQARHRGEQVIGGAEAANDQLQAGAQRIADRA